MAQIEIVVGKTLSVVPPGTHVRFVNAKEVVAVVLQVALTGDEPRVQYEVAFWSGNTRSTCWVDDFEVSADVPERLRIGFERGAT